MPAPADAGPLDLSVVVIAFNMRREIPRTLRSLSPPYQRGITRDRFEVILVDNGSDEPWRAEDLADCDVNLRIVNLGARATPSPAAALNLGIAEARGTLVGAVIDGARMASPGLLCAALAASRMHPRPVVTSFGFHLGFEHQSRSVQQGYTREVEDRLLASIDWPGDGYRLFDIAVFSGSCQRGWFAPMAESNAVFMSKALWREVGGFDEAFAQPGGGLVNLDLHRRALALPGAQQLALLGEGTFHQVHGGVSSNAAESGWSVWGPEYTAIRGEAYQPPTAPAMLVGQLGPHGAALLEHSVQCVTARPTTSAAAAYIDLLAQVLLNETHPELELAFLRARDAARGRVPLDERELLDVATSLPERFAALQAYRQEGRLLDGDLANMPQGYTMVGRRRLDNIRVAVEAVLREAIPGDLMECGVWKGGACIFMRGILVAHGVTDRRVWVADSFQGLPSPDPATDEGLDLSAAHYPQLAISIDMVRRHFARFGLLDDQVRFLHGWFADTLPAAPVDRLAVLRLDGDLYSSTMDVLAHAYDKVSPGGFIIVDDYGVIPQCARAVEDFRRARGITTPIVPVDITGVYWRKDR